MPIFYASRELKESAWFDNSLQQKWYSKENVEKCIIGLSSHLSKMDNIRNQKSKNILNENFNFYIKSFENKPELLENNSSNSLITKIRNKLNYD